MGEISFKWKNGNTEWADESIVRQHYRVYQQQQREKGEVVLPFEQFVKGER